MAALRAAPASLPAGVVLEQQRDDIARGEFIARMVAGDDMSQVLDAEPRSNRPPGVEDLRGVLDLARTGTWARWILAEGGDGYRGVVFECTDGTLSVPEVVPALAGTGISLERSREVLAELG